MAELLTHPGRERAAVTVDALALLAISVTLRVLWFCAAEDRHCCRRGLCRAGGHQGHRFHPDPRLYLTAVGLGLVLSQVAAGLPALAIAYQAAPSRTIYRLLRGGS